MQNSDEIKKAKLRAMKLLTGRDYTEAVLRSKLIDDKYSDEAVEAAIEYVRSYGYIDDLRYAQNYVRCNNTTRSPRDMAMRLRNKGVSQDIIETALKTEGADESEETELIKRLIRKKCPDPKQLDHMGRQKLYAYMYGKGFDTGRVSRVLDDMNDA